MKHPHKIDDLRRESEASKHPEEHLPRYGVKRFDKIDKKHPGILLKPEAFLQRNPHGEDSVNSTLARHESTLCFEPNHLHVRCHAI